MTISEKVKITPLAERPLINDTPGKPSHPMNDECFAEYLQAQEAMAQMPPPPPDPTEVKLAQMQAQIDALLEGRTGA